MIHSIWTVVMLMRETVILHPIEINIFKLSENQRGLTIKIIRFCSPVSIYIFLFVEISFSNSKPLRKVLKQSIAVSTCRYV